ncbi:cysteine desulfurase NifS [Candidatus Kuenenbacteria bacterium CG_4_8_14_3_um_filter_39_15]|uniref:Cysteine desulfurase NifS n=5 Tax=Candidatus Kueneniibacteriota TaxID=1752740 RepID=A0A2M7IL10_9BACT|nr:MAG: cysteine desulfurase NifS [Candidatus Kuenenbacteria bacterium CG_4_8_14_3_um_filter_39_15]PIX92611.1 MAG: cysteine desulfurase NifS [Candidatus Kuenenbacteria bacterium CG_4_10_14_3_um_filter_39_14]
MIYLDHASTTPMDEEVVKAMAPFYNKKFANPSSLYKIGREAARAIADSRESVAKVLNCQAEEIVFTAGGTESDNLAIFGIANQFIRQPPENPKNYHLITTQIEHSAVLESFRALEQKGFQVTYLPVDKFGLVSPDELMKALKPNTILLSIMYANNEIGTIQPIAEIASIIKNYRQIQQVGKSKNPIYPILHTDGCQAAGYLDLDVDKLGVALMTLNGSKIYGPKQIGLLYKRKEIKLAPILYGGEQEGKMRPGTENVAAIVGFAKALELANKAKKEESKRLTKLRDYFVMELLKIPETILNGHHQQRLPNNINVTFKRIEGESIMLKLDAKEIYVSTGSACHSLSLKPSHVILAIGQDAGAAHGSMRFTMGKSTTKKDIDQVLKVLPKIINDLRRLTAIRK